jgi:hypothetical protein
LAKRAKDAIRLDGMRAFNRTVIPSGTGAFNRSIAARIAAYPGFPSNCYSDPLTGVADPRGMKRV